MKISTTVSRKQGTWGFGSMGCELTVERDVPDGKELDTFVVSAFEKCESLIDLQISTMDKGADPALVLAAVRGFDKVTSMNDLMGRLDGTDWASSTKQLIKDLFAKELDRRSGK